MKYQMRLPLLTLGAILSLGFASPLFAQGQQDQRQSQQQSQQQSNPPQQTQKPSLQNPQQNTPAPPPVDPKEEAAYKAFNEMKPTNAPEYDAQIKAGEDFVKNFPQSRYRESVYAGLVHAYIQKGDFDKMDDAADKALALNPNNLPVLTQTGWAIPRGNPTAPNFPQRLAKAEQYEKHALDLLSTVNKPAGLTDEQFNKSKDDASSQAHSGLGLVYFRESKFDESSAELTKATSVPDPDPTDYFVLGVDLEQLQKYADSVKAFDSCAQITSSLQARCKQGSAEAKAKEGAAPPRKP